MNEVLYYSEALPTIQHGYCIGASRRSAQAIAGKGLAQGPYVAARARVESTTIRLKVIVSTKAPTRLTTNLTFNNIMKFVPSCFNISLFFIAACQFQLVIRHEY